MSQDFEQKLIAVLFADVVGYSRLSSEDELATHRTLKNYLDILTGIVEEHGGTVVNYAGGCAAGEFDSVSGALSSAVEMQQELKGRNERLPANRRLVFRVGINLGEVIVDHDDIFGGGVNVAARLEGLADPGGICMSGSVYDAIGNKLGYRYEYMGEQKVKNIDQPVRSYRVIADDKIPINKEPPPARNRAMYLSIGLVLLTIIGLVLYSFIAGQLKTSSKNNQTATQFISETASAGPSIAVLPFSNLSGETEQEYFSDGITNDIITDLSQLSNLLVIASNSVFVYKNTPVKVQQVAAELGVTHVLEGSVQKSGQRIRINAQLIDAASGHHM
jgi:adenylate cyclase